MRNPKSKKGRRESNGSPRGLPKAGSTKASPKVKRAGSTKASSKVKRAGSTKASPKVKRVKAPAPAKQRPEPETFPDHRNMEDLWLAAFPVGTEWDQLDSVYKYNWDFSNLEKSFEEGGELHGKKVYLFGCTEPQLVFLEGQGKIVCIPVVVAVTSPFPPSDKIGIKSVQMEGETVVPMKQMKMNWIPYIPFEDRLSSVERLKTQIFTLQCTQRRAALKQLNIERIKKYEYCLPHFYQPLKEDEIEQDTVVQIMYPMEPPVVCDFDWEFDEIEEFTDSLITEEALPSDQKEEFMKFIKERVTESKKKQREAKQARKKAIEEMSPESKAAFENMRFYKFYPVQTPHIPDIANVKVPFINRYYGKAHVVL